jgi:hypothetical protein
MFFHSNDTIEEGVLQESQITDSWKQEVEPFLPPTLEEFAWRLGAMTRKRGKIRRASELLRGILAYVLFANSFREVGIWGVLAGIADMADTSWRDRLRKADDWLCWLLNELIQPEKQEPCPSLKKAGYGPIELVDASHLKCVGKQGRVWRFHCMYSLLTQQIHQVVVSTTKVAESLARFCLEAGAIYVHDGGYGYRGQVAQTADAGAYSVTNFCPATFPLEDEEGKEREVVGWLKKQRAKVGSIKSLKAFFWEGGKKYEVRVVMVRRTEEQRKNVLGQKKRVSTKNHRKLQQETQYLAGWLLVLTTLPAKDWTNQEVLSLYRARWQIEMLFKRIKQLLDQHVIKAKTEETARATVAAILVSWVLKQGVATELRLLLAEVSCEMEVQQEHAEEEEEKRMRGVSEWALQKVSSDLFRQQVQGPLTRQRILKCLPRLNRHFRDSPRTRMNEWHRVTQWLVDPEKRGDSPKGGKSRNTGSALTAALA